MIGVPTGFTDLDELTNGLHGGQMVIVAARPAVGKSTFALDVARTAAIKHNLPTVVFSLEMSRTEITMRLLAAESTIPLQSMRKGNMKDSDWTRIAETQGRIHGAPLFIDDSPNMSLMEIRAKCRRLKQRHNLKLVVVDYLQLMTSGKRVESRQQEVAEFSRALKLLAKELEIPVIALSQLNRGSEQRTDKRPQMSDLRESGCLTADTRILRADTGAEVSLGELHASGQKDVPVWALDESLRYVPRHMTHVFSTGTKPVFRLTLASGKTVRATENHPFLTYDGWRSLGDLRTGDRVAVPRHVPAPERHEPWGDDEVVLDLARRLADGQATKVPDEAFHLAKRQIALLLAAVWQRAGAVTLDVGERAGAISIVTAPQVAEALARMLLRFGISTRQRMRRDLCVLEVVGRDDQRRFLQEVAVHTPGVDQAGTLLGWVRDGSAEPSTAGPILVGPGPIWKEIGQVMGEMSPEVGALRSVVQVLDREELDVEAINDVLFEPVIGVEFDCLEEVFDATVLGSHNFVANGVAVHNSIEQDADLVILLHRESMYERESPREGEADVIVAKHRNGPTSTIVVAFQGHYSRFTNMASNF
jgi:replicative DNA helicase